MTDDQIDVGKTDTSTDKLTPKPTSEDIWYALATIAGEWDGKFSLEWVETQKQNRHYWNGMMRHLMGEDAYERFEDADGKPMDLPLLDGSEHAKVREALGWRGFAKKDLEARVINFSDTAIPNIDCSGFVFPVKTIFDKTIFSEKANFYGATFSEGTSFDGATFSEETSFNKATFSKWARFVEVTFSDEAYFYGTIFFKRGYFNGATFSEGASFNGATFAEWATFNRATFCKQGNFNRAKFADALSYRAATFETHPPSFYNAKISEAISWTDAEFPSTTRISRHEADGHKDTYERLALMMDRLNKHHDQHRFFRLEMKARRAMERHPFLKLMNWLYEAMADYGYGFGRALGIWLGHIGIGAALLFPYGDAPLAAPTLTHIGNALKLWGTALVTSFSNAHGFLGLGRTTLKETIANYQQADLLLPYNVTATAQAILGVIFLFFLLLTARNRFRMG